MPKQKVPTLHQTDCFHPHCDPDDHWDLATQYALAYREDIDLKGVLIDYPPHDGDPAIGAVSQLSVITGKTAPVGVGSRIKAFCDEDVARIAAQKPLNAGIQMVLRALEESPEPVVIHIVGSARDIAIAAAIKPELFRQKCRAIYLNAGSSRGKDLEYNVNLDPFSYSRMFSVPCPLYWMPCFHDQDLFMTPGTHGTFWRFRQDEILPHLSGQMKNFFTYALGRIEDHRWLRYLNQPADEKMLQTFGAQTRNMWCTAGFLHAAGLTVAADGEIAERGTLGIRPVFDFVPIAVSCADDGRTVWEPAASETRFIFRVVDPDRYQAAMTKALCTLLSEMP